MPDKITDPNIGTQTVHELVTALVHVRSIYGQRDNCRESIPMGSLSTVFQAEVMAILKVYRTPLVEELNEENTYLL
jgi:hypothetical protein